MAMALCIAAWSASVASGQITPVDGGVYQLGDEVTGPCHDYKSHEVGDSVTAGTMVVYESTGTTVLHPHGSTVLIGEILGPDCEVQGWLWPPGLAAPPFWGTPELGDRIILQFPVEYEMRIGDSRVVRQCTQSTCTVGIRWTGWVVDWAQTVSHQTRIRFSVNPPVDQPASESELYGPQYFTDEDRELFDWAAGQIQLKVVLPLAVAAVLADVLVLSPYIAVLGPAAIGFKFFAAIITAAAITMQLAHTWLDNYGKNGPDDTHGPSSAAAAVASAARAADSVPKVPKIRPLKGFITSHAARRLRAYLRLERRRAIQAITFTRTLASIDAARARGDVASVRRLEGTAAGAAERLATLTEANKTRRQANRELQLLVRRLRARIAASPRSLRQLVRKPPSRKVRARLRQRGMTDEEIQVAAKQLKRAPSPASLLKVPNPAGNATEAMNRKLADALRRFAVRLRAATPAAHVGANP